ncbi:MAG: ribonuclease P protein component [Parachlamydiales bacterium]|nr:ribonuclease P protein component [Parachlamydiales bacterium]
MSHNFPKSLRLRKRREFHRVTRHGPSRMGKFLLITIQKSYRINPRLGITVTRRFGKAHERNRFKRLVREAFRHLQHSLPSHLDIVVKPRNMSETASLEDISLELQHLVTTLKGRSASDDKLLQSQHT